MKNKVFIILILFILIIFIVTSRVLGWSDLPKMFGGIIDGTDVSSETTELKSTGGKIVGIIQVVGTIVAVGMLIVLGIKYVLGSAEEKAQYKKTLFPYFIGAVLIFGASNLAQIIYNWANAI